MDSKHAYSTSFANTPKLAVALFVLAGGIAIGISWIASLLDKTFGLIISPISAFAIFSLLWWAADGLGWRRLGKFRRYLLVPDLNGEWDVDGMLTSKHGGPPPENWKTEWTGTVKVEQSWSRMIVIQAAEQSDSTSTCASIIHLEGDSYLLIYAFDNDPKADAESDMNRHRGVAYLRVEADASSVSGHYFTDQRRSTAGTINWTRKQDTKS